MTTYYIIDRELDVIAAEFEGNYCEALDYADEYVTRYQRTRDDIDVLTPEEYAEEYGDEEEPDEETAALVRRMCELATEVEAELYEDD